MTMVWIGWVLLVVLLVGALVWSLAQDYRVRGRSRSGLVGGEVLDRIGEQWQLPRTPGESDVQYRARITAFLRR